MLPKKKIDDSKDSDFFSWPPVKKITFASAMNLLASKKKNNLKQIIKRHDVYKNIQRKERRFREYFRRGAPWEKQIYDYMDKFVEEKYFDVVKEMEVKGKTIQELTSTQKAEELYEWLWILTNLKSKEDVGRIVSDAIRDLEKLSAEEKETIVKRTMIEIDERRVEGFPFSFPQEAIEKLRKKGISQNR